MYDYPNTPAVSAHPENVEAWLNNLRTTDHPQIGNRLAAWQNAEGVDWAIGREDLADEEIEAEGWQVGFCCLGLGSHQAQVDYEFSDGLAPFAFIDWLGFGDLAREKSDDPGEVENGWDLIIDYPTGVLLRQGREEDEWAEDRSRGGDGFSPGFGFGDVMTAARLNDDGFTFAQIADVIAYFGIRDVRF